MNKTTSIFDELMEIEGPTLNYDLRNPKLLELTYDDIISKRNLGYVGLRSGILHLSKLIEKYAIENKLPLLIDIQNTKRFLLSDNRLKHIFTQLPHVSIIGNFSEELSLDSSIQKIDCGKNKLENNWIVLTKDENGIFGLVTEQLDDLSFRGFYSGNPELITPLIKIISDNLKIDLQF